jgi:hypothetical protein
MRVDVPERVCVEWDNFQFLHILLLACERMSHRLSCARINSDRLLSRRRLVGVLRRVVPAAVRRIVAAASATVTIIVSTA